SLFFSNDPSAPQIYTLPLHDALPISPRLELGAILGRYASAAIDLSDGLLQDLGHVCARSGVGAELFATALPVRPAVRREGLELRSEEHTSELQSRENLVCRLLLEKKK